MTAETGGRQAIVMSVWREKYRFTRLDGGSDEHSPTDSHARVCRGVYALDPRRAEFEAEALEAMTRMEWCPGGRIHAGAGTGRGVTLINCFVNATVPDTMAGIMDANTRAALTMQQGGGIGTDFSTIRPRGAVVEGVGSVASGPISFMEIWQATCGTIMSGGSRRGAMMGTLADDHPDLPDFIAAKREPGRLTNFNVSVLVGDAFMSAVEHDLPWDLGFGVRPADASRIVEVKQRDGRPWWVYRRLPARQLWELITRNSHDFAEPGVIFIDRVNALNNLAYCETIRSTNPCVTADTWVHTAEGPRQVAELSGRPFVALVDGQPWPSDPEGFFTTGVKTVLRLATREGHTLRLTADHPVRRVVHRSRWRIETEWAAAGRVRPGDQVVLNDHRHCPDWPGPHGEAEGYLIGLLVGRGGSVRTRAVANGRHAGAVMIVAVDSNLAAEFGLAPGHMTITPAIERDSAAFTRGVLRGLFDENGGVRDSRTQGASVHLALRDPASLAAAQRMLLRLGVTGAMADGGLVISGETLFHFAERVGFADGEKAARLKALLSSYRRRPNRETFLATVSANQPEGEAAVYDVRIPGVNAFDANGLLVHNCGEQPLPPNGACNLGCVNLAVLVREPFSERAWFDFDRLAEVARIGMRFLDNVLDVTLYPLPEQEAEARGKRRTGLGVMGLANALQMMRLRYGGHEAEALVGRIMEALRDAAYGASIELAKERGAFPLFDRDAHLAAPFVRTLPTTLRDGIAAHGIRNGVLMTIAPTGTTAIYYDNVSSGLEPTFGWRYFRKVLQPDGSRKEYAVVDAGFAAWCARRGLDPATAPTDDLPDYMVTALELSVEDHLRTQAVCQRHVDASISKTINCPADMGWEEFQAVYRLAYELGCKGCTTYRPSGVRGSVLSTAPAPSAAAEAWPPHRPPELDGKTYKLKWPLTDENLYVTINDLGDPQGARRPFEIFIASRSAEHAELLSALTITLSAVMRRSPDPSFLVEDLERVRGAQGAWVDGRYVNGLVALIARAMRRHLEGLGLMRGDGPAIEPAAPGSLPGELCPKCDSPTLFRQEGCRKCASCGYSDCS
ncbi:MAG: ribonucleoside reductase [Alphaproteobacteria bacterium]|nr:ribonucleoside reductase [Alphaproteobacteria bacterium]